MLLDDSSGLRIACFHALWLRAAHTAQPWACAPAWPQCTRATGTKRTELKRHTGRSGDGNPGHAHACCGGGYAKARNARHDTAIHAR